MKRGLFATPTSTMVSIKKEGKKILRSLARNQQWVGSLWIAQYASLCNSTHLSNRQSRFRCRAFHDFLVECDVHHQGYSVRGKASRKLIKAVEWWVGLGENREVEKAIWEAPLSEVWATDASKRAWGGLRDARPLSELRNICL
jgi:hypothetical protein